MTFAATAACTTRSATPHADIHARIQTANASPTPVVWTKAPEDILDPIAHYHDRINDSRH